MNEIKGRGSKGVRYYVQDKKAKGHGAGKAKLRFGKGGIERAGPVELKKISLEMGYEGDLEGYIFPRVMGTKKSASHTSENYSA